MKERIKIMLDPGHVANYNRGAVPSYYEGSKMYYLANYMKEELEKYDIFDVYCTRQNINDNPTLLERVQMAAKNDCSVLLSLHTNAVGSSGGTAWGTMTYRSIALPNSVDLATRLNEDIYNLILKDVPKTINRGIRTYKNSSGTDYYGILRHSVTYPVIKYSYIIEHLFHTTYEECAWMNQDSNLRKLAKTEAKTLATYFGAELKAEDDNSSTNITYTNYTVVKGDTLSKIALKFYGDANKYPEIMSYNGLTNTTIYVNQALRIPNLDKNTSDEDKLTKISGTSIATVKQLEEYIHAINPAAPYYGDIFISEGKAEGIRGDIAFAQSCLETGNFTFKGNVKPEQNNFAGIGATGGVSGNSFETPTLGIRAQIQHLKAYANDSALTNECIDSRFKYVARASAPYVEWLGIPDNPTGHGWASGKDYGKKILDILDAIIDTKVKEDSSNTPVADPEYVEYTIQKGDSFWKIAQKMMGDGSLFNILAAFNNMSADSIIHAGTVIKIPKSNTINYTIYSVKNGDSFWRIAKEQMGDGNRYKELASFNNMDINTIIYAGDKIKIPN